MSKPQRATTNTVFGVSESSQQLCFQVKCCGLNGEQYRSDEEKSWVVVVTKKAFFPFPI
jgi:hypothetical protein